MLTIGAIKAAAPRLRAYKLFDGGGLHIHIAPTGTKSWRLKYRVAGREKLLTIGQWPAISLPEARVAREEAKATLREGRDPGSTVDVQGKTFAEVAHAWHALHAPHWSTTHAADVMASLERDILPAIGTIAVDTITPPQLLAAIRAIETRGRGATARRVRQRCGAIFGYAIAEGLCSADPSATIARAMLPPRLHRPQPALTSIDTLRELLAACDRVDGAPAVRLASRMLALTAVRLDAVRGMRWGEIEGLDTAVPFWRVPAARMKLARAKKADARFDHLVPLSAATIAVVIEAGKIGDSNDSQALVFPGAGKNGLIGERAIADLYRKAGFAGRHVPHGWRAAFSTILNEQLPEERTAIDQALGHAAMGKVEAAYNRAEQLERRRALFHAWGALLTA